MKNMELHLSSTDKKLGGVCGGIAESMGVDTAIIRIIAVALLILSHALFLVAYFVLWAVLPEE